MLVAKGRGATICPSSHSSALRCIEKEAYNNQFLVTAENLFSSVMTDMPRRSQLLYIFSILEHHQPTAVPEMILQLRFRQQKGPEEGAKVVAYLQNQLGILHAP
jgi:hypothetical protein